jgi:non-specific serine/threonine protein kinase/serine/threonine-protein kinase
MRPSVNFRTDNMSLDKKKVEEVCAAALGIAIPAEREAFVGRICGADTPLREDVLSLLAAHEERAQFGSQLVTLPNNAKSAETAPQEQSGVRVGRYKLLEKLGEGAFGDVWRSEQEEPVRRRVALKVIKLGMDTKEVIARFEAERQALALMDSPEYRPRV